MFFFLAEMMVDYNSSLLIGNYFFILLTWDYNVSFVHYIIMIVLNTPDYNLIIIILFISVDTIIKCILL